MPVLPRQNPSIDSGRCIWWTCPSYKTRKYTFANEFGDKKEVVLCEEHKRLLDEAALVNSLDVIITAEGWMYADTYSWHLRTGDDWMNYA